MKITYTAWLRDMLGISEETVELPAEVTDVGLLIDWLGHRDARYGKAFEFIETVKVAVNQVYVDSEHAVTDDDEVILFPPIAGG